MEHLHAITILFVAIGLAIGWWSGGITASVCEMFYGDFVSYNVRKFLTRTIHIAILAAATVAAYFLSTI